MKKKLLITIVSLVFLVCIMVACNTGDSTQNGDNDYEYVVVTFDTQGGSAIDSQRIKKGEYATKPTKIPQKDGYEFDDWYIQKDGGAKFDFTLPIMSDTIVYAVYTAHVHTYDKEHWAYDANYHWHESTCGHTYAVADKQAHDFLGNICKICGYENDEEHIHVLTYHEAKDATCTEPGNNAYWECPRCGKYFSDSTGENEIALSAVQIDALGHAYDNAAGRWSWNDEYTQATYTVECSRCDEQKLYTAQGEDIIEGESKEPTCTASGFVYYSATVMIDSVEYESSNVKKTIAPLGHDYENGEWGYNSANHWKVCARCGNSGERTLHSFGDEGICECGMVEVAPANEFRFISLGNNTWRLANYTGNRQMVSIPSEYNRGTVVEISDNAFYGCDGIETLVIPDTITGIGSGAFAGCTNIKNLTISANVETIGEGAFADCNLITTAILPANAIGYISKDNLKSVTVTSGTITANAFANCSSLNDLIIKSTVTAIKNNAFENCDQLTNVEIEYGVKSIEENAFKGCSAVSNITIPDSVTSIGQAAFSGCSGLEVITLPFVGGAANARTPSASTLFGYIFGTESYVGSLETVQIWGVETTQQATYYIPSYLKTVNIGGDILYGAFYGCDRIESIVMTNSKLASLGDYAFYNCVDLKIIEFPASVVNIGEMAFAYCLLLEDIPFSENTSFVGANAMMESSWYASQSEGLVYIGKTLYAYKGDMPYGAEIVIIDGTKCISDYAFAGCTNYAITIPKSVSAIGGSSFEDCTFDSITCAANHLAYFVKNSTSQLTITTGSIPEKALYEWDQLDKLTLMDGVTSIGSSAFRGCTGLTSITIPDSVTSIGSSAFSGCSSLESITIPFVGAEAGKTSSDTYQYPFGYIFGTSSYTGGTAVKQYYYGSSTSSTTSTTYYIPSSLRSVTVTGGNILYGAFDNCSMLTSVTIPNSVTSIGKEAFYGCSGLTSVTIPDSVTSIGNYAFSGCSGLTSVTIPDSVTSIGQGAFKGCTAEIVWGDNPKITDIGSYAFSGYEGTSITIPDSVTSIGNYAFSGCTGLTSITIPDSVTSIGSSAFRGCTGLASITIPDSVTSIGSGVFSGCTSLKSITIPFVGAEAGKTSSDTYQYPFGYIFGTSSYTGGTAVRQHYYYSTSSMTYDNYYIPSSLRSVTVTGGNILYGAFYNCSMLTSVTIGNGVTSIGERAFYGCSGLTSVTIPDGVTSIGYGAFSGCNRLTSITVEEGNSVYHSVGNSIIETASKTLVAGCKTSAIPYDGSVTSIGSSAFYGCSGLTSITIPNTVTSIGVEAFSNCTGLTSVTIPDSVTSIRSSAFEDCSKLTSVTIPDSVMFIGNYAYSGCTGLTSITIPDSVTSMGSSVFAGCSSLESIAIPFVGAEAGKTSSDTYQYPFGYIFGTSSYTGGTAVKQYYYTNSTSSTALTTYYIPSSLRSVTVMGGNILYGAFYNCSMLTSITIPDSVTGIGSSSFSGCTAEIVWGDKIKTIGSYAFSGYEGTSITIPDSVTSIGSYAFEGCTAGIVWGDNPKITDIGSYAFSGYEGTSITIPDRVTSIGRGAFEGCSSLESITIPFVGETKDGTSDTHFGHIFGANYYNFNDDYVPDSLKAVIITGGTSIGSSAFYNCSGLTSVTIPNTVTSIGGGAFSGCSGVIEVVDGISYVDGWVVGAARDIKTASIRQGTRGIAASAFSGCSGLTSVTIPDSVTSIGDYAFYNCSGLTSITIPDSVTSIGDYAFYNCSGLTSITIPDSVTSIGDYVFDSRSGLTSVYYAGDMTSWLGITGLGGIMSDGRALYIDGNKVEGAIIIPNGTTSIPSEAFAYQKGITSVTIPDSVTSIGEDAFSGCTGLNSIYYAGDMTSWLGITGLDSIISDGRALYIDGNKVEGAIIIPNGTTSIPSEAFAYQKGITSVTIPDSVTSIGNYAFKGCDSLTSVSIGDGVTSIGRDAFEGCTALTEIHYTGDMESWWSIDGLDNIISSGRTWYIDGNKAAGDIVIPDGTTSIPSYAFEDCTGLTSVKIPDSVKSIGRNAFEGCSSLTSITIPESVTSIGWNAFDGCSSLTSITIPESVTSIGQSAFEGCTSLTSVTIGNGVTSIGFGAFQRCTALTSVNYNGTKAQWSAISKDSYWKYNSAIKKVVCTDGTITL